MSLEQDLVAVAQTQCPRVYPSTAPVNTPRPFVTWDHIGGDSLRYMEGTAPTTRLAQLQVTVWADTKNEGTALQLALEDAFCNAAGFTCSPLGGLQGGYEHDAQLWRTYQDYEVLGQR